MRKIELVHLHSLFRLLKRRVERRDGVDEGAFEAYEGLDVSPTQVYRGKDEHREAVLALSGAVADQFSANGKYCPDDERTELAPSNG